VTDIRQELSSLTIDRERPARGGRWWPALLLLPILAALAAFFMYGVRRWSRGVEVETVRASIAPNRPSTAMPRTEITTKPAKICEVCK